jgi:hypothetical protein
MNVKSNTTAKVFVAPKEEPGKTKSGQAHFLTNDLSKRRAVQLLLR